jgi:hypothetical protein
VTPKRQGVRNLAARRMWWGTVSSRRKCRRQMRIAVRRTEVSHCLSDMAWRSKGQIIVILRRCWPQTWSH